LNTTRWHDDRAIASAQLTLTPIRAKNLYMNWARVSINPNNARPSVARSNEDFSEGVLCTLRAHDFTTFIPFGIGFLRIPQ
jgi:hypothetical protein